MAESILFPKDGDFKKHVLNYIRENYADVLGEHVGKLEQEGGLEEIMDLVRMGKIGPTV